MANSLLRSKTKNGYYVVLALNYSRGNLLMILGEAGNEKNVNQGRVSSSPIVTRLHKAEVN